GESANGSVEAGAGTFTSRGQVAASHGAVVVRADVVGGAFQPLPRLLVLPPERVRGRALRPLGGGRSVRVHLALLGVAAVVDGIAESAHDAHSLLSLPLARVSAVLLTAGVAHVDAIDSAKDVRATNAFEGFASDSQRGQLVRLPPARGGGEHTTRVLTQRTAASVHVHRDARTLHPTLSGAVALLVFADDLAHPLFALHRPLQFLHCHGGEGADGGVETVPCFV